MCQKWASGLSFFTTRGQLLTTYRLARHRFNRRQQHNAKIKPYVQNDLKEGGRGGLIWRQFKEQHILIYGPLNEVARTFVFAQTFEYLLFLYIDVCIIIYFFKKMAYLCTGTLHISCRRNTQYVMLRQVTVHVKGRNGDNWGSPQDHF